MRELIKFRHDPANQFVSSYICNAIEEQHFIRNIEILFGGQKASDEYVSEEDDIF